MFTITSTTNVQIKRAAALKQKKFRDKEGCFLLEGTRLLETALSSCDIKECFFSQHALLNDRCQKLIAALSENGCTLYQVTDTIFSKLTDTDSSQGIIGVANKKSCSLKDLLSSVKSTTILILDQLQDPGNVGNIIRTAEAMGIDGIITMQGTVDIYSPKVVRASMGGICNLPIVDKIAAEKLQSFCNENAIHLFATILSPSAISSFAADYKKNCGIILGNEANGISKQLLALADDSIYIPMQGKAESLNAATAAAMITYEIMRQRFN